MKRSITRIAKESEWHIYCFIQIHWVPLTTIRLQQTPGYNEQISLHEYRVTTCQRNVREKQNFLQDREKSGNFEKMSGNFGHLTHVKELPGNFVMSCQ